MPFDDEDVAPASLESAAKARNDTAAALSDSDADDQTPDFRFFASKTQRQQASGKNVRKGEKDFESHGTRAQEGALESSRSAMHDVLSYTRQQASKGAVRAWYFPDQWAEMPPDDTSYTTHPNPEEKGPSYALFSNERVAVVESSKGSAFYSQGRVVKSEKPLHGWRNTWLLPEETLFLVERGSLDLWWPARGIEDVLPMDDGKSGEATRNQHLEDHELGVPLSLQAAYALLVGRDGERGKISLEQYQVYANLRRTGYIVLRAMPLERPLMQPHPPSQSLWQWLLCLLQRPSTPLHLRLDFPPLGPLVKPGLYRSYIPVFEQVALIERHKPTPYPPAAVAEPQDPFKVHFHLWKNNDRVVFTKTRPPPPDFRICVVDARDTSVPTMEQLDTLLMSTPYDPPPTRTQDQRGPGFVYKRLKHGWRNVVLGVVDRGMISYMTVGEMAFGEEKLYENVGRRPRAKKGNRSGQRGGRGQGRGRGRGRGG